MIELRNINVAFNQGTALENIVLRKINLTIHDGDCITVIGGNGAGKSTLLSTICGNLLPTSGSIFCNEEEITLWPTWKRTSFIGRVFQSPQAGTCGDLSIEENMALACSRTNRRGLALAVNNQRRNLFKERLEVLKLGLENRLDSMVSELSGGQRQALSLAMTTLQPMQLLILDEPCSALDPKTEKVITKAIKNIIKVHNLTAIMVTHSMKQALEVGNRLIMLKNGSISQDLAINGEKALSPQDLLEMFQE